jgi:hypothetical protein
MIKRYYVICAICKTHHTLRVQVGYGEEQKHRFPCHHCNEPITFNLLPGKIETAGAEPTDLATGADGETSFQYLSPDFVADSADARNPTYFGSMEIMKSFTKKVITKKRLTELWRRGMIDEGREGWFALSNAQPDWATLQVCWRLERSGKYFLAGKNLSLLDPEARTSSWLAAVRLGHRIFGANDGLLTEVRQILAQSSSEASRLVMEHGYRWASDFSESEYQVFSEFFKRWDAFSPVYLYVRHDLKMPRDPAATSFDFEHIRGFYSMAQEFFAKQVGLLTALNNIKAGRPFDQLNKISLEKYFNTDNAKRRDNLQDNSIFFAATSEYDSGLRNAEAHSWLRATAETQHLRYMQGGDGAVVELRYVDYLQKSLLMFRQICRPMQVENILKDMALKSASRLLLKPSPMTI